MLYEAKYQDGLLTPNSGRMLAVIQLSITNQGETKTYVGPNSFEVENGRHITEIDQLGTSLRDIQGIENQPLDNDTILPGETKQGWLLASITTDTAKSGLRIALNRDSEGSDPEVRWTHSSGDLPIYEVVEVDFPSEVEIGTETEGTITVKNTGSTSGTFQGIVERRNNGETTWQRVETFSLELAAGSSSSHTIPIQEPYLAPSQYRIRPGAVTRTVDFVAATRTLGGTYTNPSGASILANIGGFNFDGLTSKYIYKSWENKTVEASDGNTFAFVKVSVENTANESISFPSPSDFTIVSDGEEYSVAEAVPYGTATFVSPMEGEGYTASWLNNPGVTDSGWLLFEIPDSLTKVQLTVQYSPNEKITAEWSAST